MLIIVAGESYHRFAVAKTHTNSSSSTFRFTRSLTPALALVLGASSPAWAGGFAVARFGGEHGHAASDHPTTIYYNPAGLARGTGTRVYLEGLFAYRTASYERPEGAVDRVVEEGESSTGTPSEVLAANAGRAELSNVIASPFVGAVSDLGIENLGVGLGLYVPFGGSTSWSQNDAFADSSHVGAIDGVQRWHVIEGEQRALYMTAAGAYHLAAADLTFGLGVNLVRNEVATIRARTANGTDHMATGGGEIFEGRSLLDVSGTTLSIGVGAMWDPIEELTVGLSYQSVPGFGTNRLKGTLTNKFGTGPIAPVDVVLEQTLPDIVRLGAAYRLPRAELRLAGDYQRWSVFENQCLVQNQAGTSCALTDTGAVNEAAGGNGVVVNIPRDFRDTFGVRLGGSYWVTPPAEVFLSMAYDSNAVPDETLEPTVIDMNKVVANGGVRYTLPNQRFALMASLTQVFYADRTTEPRARDGAGAPIAPDAPSRNPDGAGTYSQSISLATIGIEGRF
jgi:long-chain fatty acid transport protein